MNCPIALLRSRGPVQLVDLHQPLGASYLCPVCCGRIPSMLLVTSKVHGTVATSDQAPMVPLIRREPYGLPTLLLRLVPVLVVAEQLMTIK